MVKMSVVEKFFVNRKNGSLHKIMAHLERPLTISNSSHVLEVGAGVGKLSLLISERYHPASLYVTDFDEEQMKLAEKNVKETYGAVPRNLRLEKADVLDLRYSDETFDTVFALMVLHHLSGHELPRALDSLRRVLKIGGQLVYSEMFRKKKIKRYLSTKGFEISYCKTSALGLVDLVIATRRN